MKLFDIFLGEPEYDENGKVVRRNFQIQNLALIVLVGYLLFFRTKGQAGGASISLGAGHTYPKVRVADLVALAGVAAVMWFIFKD